MEHWDLTRVHEANLKLLKEIDRICRKYKIKYMIDSGTLLGAVRHQGFIPWDDDIDIAMPRHDFDKFIKIIQKTMGDKYLVLNGKNYPGYPLMTTRLVKRGTVFAEKVMKDVDCPFGIFLDLYVLDNVSDNPVLYQIQSWEAWFYSKLLILRSIPEPTLAQKGMKAKLIWSVCRMVHKGLLLLSIKPEGIRCEQACRRYRKQQTRRMAFLPDTSPYWNVVDREKCYPLQKLEFEGRMLNFPANLDEMLRSMYGDYMVLPPVEKRKTHYPYRLQFSEETSE
jgi:lipopolysaccharide cholinephosphotransferase